MRKTTPMGRPARTALALFAGAALSGSILLGTAGTAVAAPAPNAVAKVDTTLRVTGLAGDNNLTISKVDGQNVYRITDTAPITAQAGCAVSTAPAGQFAVICRALTTPSGAFKQIFVNPGAGNDTARNLAPVGMNANGGPGDDDLRGGALNDNLRDDSGNDRLSGGAGDDELNTVFELGGGTADVLVGGTGNDRLEAGAGNDELRGGAGNDRLEGGPGRDRFDGGSGKDVVSYQGGGNVRHVISLDGQPNDGRAAGLTGPAIEGDNVLDSVETVQGSPGPDTMIGNDDPNTFEGFDGNDVLIGGRGADLLRGGTGNDTLASNDLFAVPVADGAIDTLDGFTGTDRCRIPFTEADVTISCEVIDKD